MGPAKVSGKTEPAPFNSPDTVDWLVPLSHALSVYQQMKPFTPRVSAKYRFDRRTWAYGPFVGLRLADLGVREQERKRADGKGYERVMACLVRLPLPDIDLTAEVAP
jgi:hypothetical protein